MKLRTWSSLALLLVIVAATSAASLAITRASWNANNLYVSGTAPSGSPVTISNAATSTPLGNAQVENNGRWRAVFESLGSVPCRVRVTQGGSSVERAVSGAPSSCDGGATKNLTGLAISGPATVLESTTATYAATASFSDGSTQNVTSAATWGENSSFASISAGGVLTTDAVTTDQSVLITSSYTSGGVTKTATLSVALQDAPAALTSLVVTGPATVFESSVGIYAATAGFSDGTTRSVTAAAAWSTNSPAATITGGILTTNAVTSNQTVLITSSYTSGGIAKTATLLVTVANAPSPTGSHAGRFDAFEGTSTCRGCHESQAKAFHASVHYQWSGDASDAEGLTTTTAGKMGGINDFCIYPDINWLGKLTNQDGVQVDGGCARCHTGLGAKPSPDATDAQLNNIDCLICHSPSYRRTVAMVNGSWALLPDATKMTVSLLQAAVDISKPGKDACLNCHTKAGGGDNFKRGDLSEKHRTATVTAALDVHMAPSSAGGAGLECTDCHTTSAHRIAGRGVDMRERDSPDRVECSNCHTSSPHDSSRLNSHTARVACNVCHIPTFAKAAKTDMRRDWKLPGDLNPATKLFEPNMRLESNVTPEYRFFNGRSSFYEFGQPAVPQANGKVLMAGPFGGSRTETGAKITAMKRHEGNQPIDPVTQRLLPLKIGIFFSTGDVSTSVYQGASGVGWSISSYEFAETERYMGVYHEVAPASQALTCSSCHGATGTRLDFAALGYTPKDKRNGVALCSSCHSAKTGTFTFIHEKHVTDKKIDCINCHTFSKD